MKKDFDKKLDEMSKKYKLHEEENTPQENPATGYVLGISFVMHVIVGLFMGIGLDKYFDTAPLFLLLLLFLGFASGFRHLWKVMK
ncbi:MAG TPA: magnesium transporter [Alphaproteobacteria bacterium]|nr:magnesium transporter [Alphaproteobacteria bacterium]